MCFSFPFDFFKKKISFSNYYCVKFHTFDSCVSWFGDLEVGLKEIMEHGSFTDNSAATFSLTDEDHTIANAVRFTLNQESVHSPLFSALINAGFSLFLKVEAIIFILCSPRVTFCGYSIPHPSEARVNIRVQTTGKLHITLFSQYFCWVQVLLVVECENLQVIQQERY